MPAPTPAPAPQAAERLRAHGIRTTIISGGSAAESAELLRTAVALGTDAVVVAGGDGTVHLAIQELAGTGIPLGHHPGRHRQRLRRARWGCSELDVAAAAEHDRRGRTRVIDLARVTRGDGSTTYFGSVLASGFDSKVNDRANAMRWPRGGSRYNIAILVEFLRLRGIPYEVELTLADGTRERIDGDLVMATVGNGAHAMAAASRSAPTPIPPTACSTSTLVRPAGRLRLLRLLPRVYKGTHATSPRCRCAGSASVRLRPPASRPTPTATRSGPCR